MFSGLGADGQFVNVIPSQNMVWIRMGEDPTSVPVPYLLNNDIWVYINDFECELSTTDVTSPSVTVYPNPVKDQLYLSSPNTATINYQLYTTLGQLLQTGKLTSNTPISTQHLSKGLYLLVVRSEKGMQIIPFVKM